MEKFAHVAIATIVIFSTMIQQNMACPVHCQCIDLHVACVNKALPTIPRGIEAQEVMSLDFHGNHITSLTDVFHDFTSIEELDLSFNRLQDIETDFQHNLKLRWLSLESNNITWLHPDAFQQTTNLSTLNLANNCISRIPSAIFHKLDHLKHLDLNGNRLLDLSKDSFINLGALTLLDLSDNEIRDLCDMFENVPSLKTLEMSHNVIRVLDGQCFHGNNTLTHLNLSHNQMQVISNLSLLYHLHTLDLSWNNISDISNSTFKGLVNLTYLVLDGNVIESISKSVFKDLKNLQTLSLSRMPNLKYLSSITFDGLDNLLTLRLHHNPLLSFIHKQLFLPLGSVSIIDLSFNQIVFLQRAMFVKNIQLVSLNIQGNSLSCDCSVEWILESIQSNESILTNSNLLDCVSSQSNLTETLSNINAESLNCSAVRIVSHSPNIKVKIGRSAILRCNAESVPSPEITWITPHKRVLHYHNYHGYSTLDYLPLNDSSSHANFHASHPWHEQTSYFSEAAEHPDHYVILEDGSLYIDYITRPDGGPYKCIAKNPRNQTEIVITLYLDTVLTTTKLWSFAVGGACAGSFFLLNLIYSLTLAAVRRCISQRRRERIKRIIENMDQYKTAQLARIKENYNHQVGRIRDQYHYQLGRLREHHHSQVGRMGRMREGASNKVEKLKDNYNNQLGRLKDYSSTQLVQIREKYNNQIYKIKDYGNDKLDRIHEKYKLKQQHVIKLLEMMNIDNCRTVFESECVRTESTILGSDIFSTDVPMHSPLDSVSVSESEYLTAASSESSKHSSQENLNKVRDGRCGKDSASPISSFPSSDEDETYHIVNEHISDTEPVLVRESTDKAKRRDDDDNMPNLSWSKRKSLKRRTDSVKQKNTSSCETVLKLPPDICSDPNDFYPLLNKVHGRQDSAKVSRGNISSDPHCVREGEASTSAVGGVKVDYEMDLIPGGVIKESTV